MELDWLETFLAVVDHGGFTAASEQVHRSQSRVSAHIAALERDLGVRLIDRTHRPAVLTPAGEVFVTYAREVVAGIGSARSAVGALRGFDEGRLTLLSTRCVGPALLPAVLAAVAAAHPGLRFTVVELGGQDAERRLAADGVALAVLPRLDPAHTTGGNEHVLWREGLVAAVPAGHPLGRGTGTVGLERLTGEQLLTCGASDRRSDAQRRLAAAGVAAPVLVTVDSPLMLVETVRCGLGVGVADAVTLAAVDTTGLDVLPVTGGAGLEREVAAYWPDALGATPSGRDLLRAVLEAPLPPGVRPGGAAGPP